METGSPHIRFGCQTYTWQMSFEKYRGKVEHILSTVHAAGLEGLEPELCMLGDFAADPARLQSVLQKHGVTLGALCLVCDWQDANENADEAAQADAVIALLRNHFPESVLVLCQMPGRDRTNISERQKNALACINAVGKRAHAAGVVAAFHPNSPEGSIFRTADDYHVMLMGLDTTCVGFAPDAGHIAKGGMDPVAVIGAAISTVRHVHFKDMDAEGNWAEMGHGIIDFRAIVEILNKAGYRGWIMIENESALAEIDPDAATLASGHYIAKTFN